MSTEPSPVQRGTYCTRCSKPIPAECFPQYLLADHLCRDCEQDGTDAEVWARITEQEKERARKSGLVRDGNGRG